MDHQPEIILYGQIGSRIMIDDPKDIFKLAVQLQRQLSAALSVEDEQRLFHGYCIEEYDLATLLRDLDPEEYYFSGGLDHSLSMIPALSLQAVFSTEALERTYPQMRIVEDRIYAERYICDYVSRHQLQLIGVADPKHGGILGLNSSLIREGNEFTLGFPLISSELELSDRGVHSLRFP